jgi:hypothetical protein
MVYRYYYLEREKESLYALTYRTLQGTYPSNGTLLRNMLQRHFDYQTTKPTLLISIKRVPYESLYCDVELRIHAFYMFYMK